MAKKDVLEVIAAYHEFYRTTGHGQIAAELTKARAMRKKIQK